MTWDIQLFYQINHGLAHPCLDSVMWWLTVIGWGPGIWGAVSDVILVALPIHTPTGHEQEGQRPAVVIATPLPLLTCCGW